MVKLTTRVIGGRNNPKLEAFVQDRIELVMGKFEKSN